MAWSRARRSRTGTSSSAADARFLESDVVLTPRQALLLGKVVAGFSETGQPVGSKTLAADPEITAGPSTIRNELAVLEERGLLAHHHTSAGRVPTDAGYRYYVDELLPAAPAPLRLELVRREVDEAMRVTTETLSQVTNLLAIVSAPPIATTTLPHLQAPPPPPPGPRGGGMPPRPGAGAGGRRHHLARGGLEARVHVHASGRRGAGRLGGVVPQRADRGDGRR